MRQYSEPEWIDPTIVSNPPNSSMCGHRDPYTLTGFIVQWLRAKFSNSEDILMENLKGYLWDTDETISKLKIMPSFQWDILTEEQHPAIVVKRGNVTNDPMGMSSGRSGLGTDSNNFFQGVTYTSVIQGSHIIQCIGDSEAEAELLGIEIFDHFTKFRDVFRNRAMLSQIQVKGLSEVQHNTESKEYWICSIQLDWVYTYEWTINQESPILKTVGIN